MESCLQRLLGSVPSHPRSSNTHTVVKTSTTVKLYILHLLFTCKHSNSFKQQHQWNVNLYVTIAMAYKHERKQGSADTLVR